MSIRAKVFKGMSKLLSANAAVTIMQFIFYLTIVRIIGFNGLGSYFDSVIILTFISLAATWESNGFSRFIIGYYQGGKEKEARYLYRLGIIIGLTSGFVIFIVMFLYSYQISSLLYRSPVYSNIVKILGIDIALSSYNSYAGIGPNALMKFGKMGIIQILWALGRYLTGMLLLFMGYGAFGLVVGWVIGDAINSIFYTMWSRELIFGKDTRSKLKPIISYAIPLVLGSLIVTLLSNVDKLFVLYKLGLAELGIYSTIMLASSVPQMLPNSIAASLSPALLGLEEKNGLNKEIVEKSIRYTTILSIPFLLLVGAMGKPLILLLLGQRFVHDWKAFTILTVGHALMSYDIPITIALSAKKDSKALALQSVIGAIIIGFLAPYLINLYFATGAAIAYVLSRFISFIAVALPRVRKHGLLKINLNEYLKVSISSLILLFGLLFVEYLTGFNVIYLPLYITLGILIIIFNFKFFKMLDKEDYTALNEVLPNNLKFFFEIIWSFLDLPKE
ncbi:lipopolysaccharide biosynthesis protein [Caldisphaera lagunensis]|nr:oligosaccharide flippase family protein [Caldisphaera lagunensis]